MNEGLNVEKSPKVLKSEHLAEGVKPIIACTGSFEDFNKSKIFPQHITGDDFKLEDVRDVDWRSGTYEQETGKSLTEVEPERSLTAGPKTYIISPIDNSNKSSKVFLRCTGLVAAGIDKQTGKNISFLSHQDPAKFLSENKDKFIAHLRQRLTELKEKCKPNTVDIVVVGGKYFSDLEIDSYLVTQFYDDSIKLLGTEIKQIFNFEPIVLNGPKNDSGMFSDVVYYDNENRRLYLVRPKVNPNIGNFPASEVDNQTNKWK